MGENDSQQDWHKWRRREYLKALNAGAVLTAAGLAGCLGGGNGETTTTAAQGEESETTTTTESEETTTTESEETTAMGGDETTMAGDETAMGDETTMGGDETTMAGDETTMGADGTTTEGGSRPATTMQIGPSGSQESVEFALSFLTWNIGYHEQAIQGWMTDFTGEGGYPNVDMNWVDRPGSEFPTYLQSRIQGGNPPNAVDTQGVIYPRYATAGVFAPLNPIIEERVDGGMSALEEKFGEQILQASTIDGSLYRLPFYNSTSWTGYRRQWFEEAGVDPPTIDEPYTTSEYFDAAEEVVNNSGAEHGLMMLTFDFQYWPFFLSEGIDLLNGDNTAAAFNESRTIEILARIQELTDSGVIAETSFTGRWSEPNQTFASGNTAMSFAQFNNLRPIQANGDWVNEDSLGVAYGPDNQGGYYAHGWGITSSEYASQEEINATFDFINDVVLSYKWQKANATAGPTRPVANQYVHEDLANSEDFRSNNPILAKQYDIWSEFSDQVWAPPYGVGPAAATINVAMDEEISAGALGEKSPEKAVADAEQRVNEALQE